MTKDESPDKNPLIMSSQPSNWDTISEDYQLLSKLGKGSYGTVVKARCRTTNRIVAIKQIYTTPYDPRCNGLCERMNGVLKSMLKKMCQ